MIFSDVGRETCTNVCFMVIVTGHPVTTWLGGPDAANPPLDNEGIGSSFPHCSFSVHANLCVSLIIPLSLCHRVGGQ